jgi:nitrous oxide reductase accessory protein NosL
VSLRFPLLLVLFATTAAAGCGASEPARESASAPPTVTSDDRGRVLAAIANARKDRGLPAAEILDDAPPLDTAAAMIRRGASPEQAMEVAMQRVVELESSEARGWCIPSENLDAVELPSVVLEREDVTLAVVAVRRAKDAPPPPFVVCIMVLEDGSDLQGRGD